MESGGIGSITTQPSDYPPVGLLINVKLKKSAKLILFFRLAKGYEYFLHFLKL